jgi:hypothetical protein
VALADVLLMPEDDLSLAVVLKSPLFGLDDHDLFDLAYRRDTSLWNVLKRKAKDNPPYQEAADLLPRWLSRVDLTPPYEFFLDLLGENGQEMRRRMLTRLGPEAAESLDEFLDLALAFDRESPPSPWETFLVGLAASVGAGISMGFAEALSDDGSLTGRGHPLIRGVITGAMTALGGLGHTLPFLIENFRVATTVAFAVVAVELWVIAWIRSRYMDTPFLQAAFEVVLGGVIVFAAGILIGSA